MDLKMRNLIIASILLVCNAVSAEKKIVCYFNNWSVYRTGNGMIKISNINPNLCTHLIYNIAGITDDADLKVSDPYADLPSGKDGYNRFNQLRNINPNVKTLIAVGGFSEGSTRFSKIAANYYLRQAFVKNAVNFVKKYNFNGLDLQWSYPTINDQENFVQLLKELKERCEIYDLLLTGLLKGYMGVDASYDVPRVVKYLDFANIITFDLHGAWESTTGIHSPLYPGSWEKGLDRYLNVDKIVEKWLSLGATPNKLLISIPTYGRSFTLNNRLITKIGAPSSGPGNPGPYTKTLGQLGFNEICESIGSWSYHFDFEQKVPYVTGTNQWVGFDDITSVMEKVNYVKNKNLGGVFVYTLDTDDFQGTCGMNYPLLSAANAIYN